MRQFLRWRGLLSLSLGVVLGPVVALVNEALVYSANMWACGRNLRSTLNVIPLLCVIVTIGAGIAAYRNWKATGRGVEDEHENIVARVRFLAILGIAISVFSTLVVLAQWAAILTFDPCQRA